MLVVRAPTPPSRCYGVAGRAATGNNAAGARFAEPWLQGYVPARMNRLDEILCGKHVEIGRLRPRAAELHRQALARNHFRGLHSALKRSDENLAVIAEIKKASPSAGVIARSFDPVAIAK